MNRDAVEIQAQYEQQGYLSALPILSPEELQQARDAFAELERKHGEVQWDCCIPVVDLCESLGLEVWN